jgi:hypothetical protein
MGDEFSVDGVGASAPESEETQEETPAPSGPADTAEIEGYQTLAQGFLSPRHRRLCQLAAGGASNKEIGAELGYVDSRVSILLKNQYIRAEISRLQDRIFEETIKTRLKGMADPALNNIMMILTDRSGRVKMSEKADMSKWVVEKLDGKPTQTTDVGENTLSILLDRLDARGSRADVPRGTIDVTPRSGESPALEAAPRKRTEEDELSDWVADYTEDK